MKISTDRCFQRIGMAPGGFRLNRGERRGRTFILAVLAILVPISTVMRGQQLTGSESYAGPISLLDALNATVRYHPTLQSKHWDVAAGQGLRREAAGRFDTVFSSQLYQQKTNTPLSPSQLSAGDPANANQVATSTGYSLGISKQFRSGVSVNTLATMGRNADNVVNLGGISTSQYQVQTVVPLRRGRGAEAVAAQEYAATIEVHSRELDLRQSAEQLLANTAVSYWNLVAAKRNVEVAFDSEKRGRMLVDTVSALIQADQRPRNDLYEVKANLAARKTERIADQQTLVQARERLALDMGLNPSQLLSLGDPKDDFPALDTLLDAADHEIELQYAEEAWLRRPDSAATQEREKQASLLERAAKNAARSQLNLQFTTGYQQLRGRGGLTDFFGSSFSSLHRPDLQVGLVFQLAHSNNVAQGQLVTANAQLEQARLRTAEARREITVNVTTAVENVRNSVLQVRSSREAVDAFQSAVEGAQEKFRLGQASVTELLTVEDELTAAQSREVQAELAYAVALANLRLATGTVLPAQQVDHVDANAFTTIPGWER
jgi:outer membrane protein